MSDTILGMKADAPLYLITSPNMKSITARKPGKGAGQMAVKAFGKDAWPQIRLLDMTAPSDDSYTEYFFEYQGQKLTVRSELAPA